MKNIFLTALSLTVVISPSLSAMAGTTAAQQNQNAVQMALAHQQKPGVANQQTQNAAQQNQNAVQMALAHQQKPGVANQQTQNVGAHQKNQAIVNLNDDLDIDTTIDTEDDESNEILINQSQRVIDELNSDTDRITSANNSEDGSGFFDIEDQNKPFLTDDAVDLEGLFDEREEVQENVDQTESNNDEEVYDESKLELDFTETETKENTSDNAQENGAKNEPENNNSVNNNASENTDMSNKEEVTTKEETKTEGATETKTETTTAEESKVQDSWIKSTYNTIIANPVNSYKNWVQSNLSGETVDATSKVATSKGLTARILDGSKVVGAHLGFAALLYVLKQLIAPAITDASEEVTSDIATSQTPSEETTAPVVNLKAAMEAALKAAEKGAFIKVEGASDAFNTAIEAIAAAYKASSKPGDVALFKAHSAAMTEIEKIA